MNPPSPDGAEILHNIAKPNSPGAVLPCTSSHLSFFRVGTCSGLADQTTIISFFSVLFNLSSKAILPATVFVQWRVAQIPVRPGPGEDMHRLQVAGGKARHIWRGDQSPLRPTPRFPRSLGSLPCDSILIWQAPRHPFRSVEPAGPASPGTVVEYPDCDPGQFLVQVVRVF